MECFSAKRVQVIGEAEGESHDGKRRVCAAGRGEHGASRDVQISDAMDPAVGIDDAAARVGMHAGRAHVMTRSTKSGRPRIGFSAERAAQAAYAGAPKLFCEDFVRPVRRALVDSAQAPVKRERGQPSSSSRRRARPALAVWRLLHDIFHQIKPRRAFPPSSFNRAAAFARGA